jgi:integrase
LTDIRRLAIFAVDLLEGENMTKPLSETPITTRNARSKLPPGLYWKGVDTEVHLGYRKGQHGGTWLVRWRHPGGGYRQAPLGVADDKVSEGTLSYDAAYRAARDHVERVRKDARAAAEGPVLTVRRAVEAYIAERDTRESRRKGRPVHSDAHRLERYVIGRERQGKRKAIAPAKLADVPLHELDEDHLQKWRASLPDTGAASQKRRTVNDLKAALNLAYATHRRRLEPSLPAIIKHGLKVTNDHDDEAPLARDNQILTDAQVGKLIQAAREVDEEEEWDGDLFRLVVVLAAAGARFGQVARLRVGDCPPTRLLLPKSRKGRGKSGSIPVPVGQDVIDALQPALAGRASDAPLLERWRHKQAPGGIEWQRAGRGAWQSASELLRPWDTIRKRVKMPDVIPYALRHSSIVRGLKANLPIRLVAALHDTSVPMIERHYAKWIAHGLEELAAAAVMPLVPQEKGGRVVPIRRRS